MITYWLPLQHSCYSDYVDDLSLLILDVPICKHLQYINSFAETSARSSLPNRWVWRKDRVLFCSVHSKPRKEEGLCPFRHLRIRLFETSKSPKTRDP